MEQRFSESTSGGAGATAAASPQEGGGLPGSPAPASAAWQEQGEAMMRIWVTGTVMRTPSPRAAAAEMMRLGALRCGRRRAGRALRPLAGRQRRAAL
jgi:hypothetical protein